MKILFKNIFTLSFLFLPAALCATLRVDVLMLNSAGLPHLPARPLPDDFREYPQKLEVFESGEHRWQNRQEFQKAPWHIDKTYTWIIPSFQQKSYVSLSHNQQIVYPQFPSSSTPLAPFFWEIRPPYIDPYPPFFRSILLGHAEIYATSGQKTKMNLCLQTPQGVVSVQEVLPYGQWVIVDNPYLTALIHLEKIP